MLCQSNLYPLIPSHARSPSSRAGGISPGRNLEEREPLEGLVNFDEPLKGFANLERYARFDRTNEVDEPLEGFVKC